VVEVVEVVVPALGYRHHQKDRHRPSLFICLLRIAKQAVILNIFVIQDALRTRDLRVLPIGLFRVFHISLGVSSHC
jgi:hypothetical protein